MCVFDKKCSKEIQATLFRVKSILKGNWQNHIADHVILESNLKKYNRHLTFMKDISSKLLDSPNLFSNYVPRNAVVLQGCPKVYLKGEEEGSPNPTCDFYLIYRLDI